MLYMDTDSMGVVPAQPLRIEVQARRELVEASAATLSHTQPGVFFTVNDSNNEPLLFALDTTGADRGVWRIVGARNVDWEAASVGPCGVRTDSAAPPPNECVYLGDVGDNDARRGSRDLYRVAEPGARGPGFVGSLAAQRLSYRYPDQPHDVEAMYVAPNADTFLITKRRLTGPDSRLRPALVFRVPASAWDSAAVQAQLVDSLPVVPGSAPMRQITDAALSPDGRFLAVRTYAQVYVFATDSITGRVRGAIPPTVCNIVPLGRWQGEGVTWFGRSGKLLLTSEGQGSPMFAVDCPMPRSE
ncbi:MAG TPA: hypothetical protein VM076_14125 [Gemmatimonadaceae bacterium]|nr:hypothetical protein [Gemmatimonadaceae bacterium]